VGADVGDGDGLGHRFLVCSARLTIKPGKRGDKFCGSLLLIHWRRQRVGRRMYLTSGLTVEPRGLCSSPVTPGCRMRPSPF
jgi:hypothetical protein